MSFLQTEKPAYCYGAALCIALCYIFYLYPLDFLAGHGTFFEEGDAAQHASGSRIYLEDDWHFPPLKTMRLNTPEGISILYTDSIPLAGLVFKLFKPLLPDGFNYIGMWQVAIYLTQTLASVFLLRVWGVRSLFSSLIISCFVVSVPCLMNRMGHTSLMTHSTFLFCLGLYFYGIQERRDDKRLSLFFSFMCALAALIHPYLFAMCYAIFLAFTVDRFRVTHSIPQLLEKIALSLVVCTSILLLAGYSGSSTVASGFGYFSMNLLSPFLPWGMKAKVSGGQAFEGFNYLGLGVLLLFPFACFMGKKYLVFAAKKYRALLILMLLFFLYSLSNRIYLGTTLVASIHVPSFLSGLFGTFRASGRFFWPVGYLCLFFVVFIFLKKKRLLPELLLVTALVVQLIEASPLRAYVMTLANRPAESKFEGWAPLLEGVVSFDAYPTFQPENPPPFFIPPDMILLLQRVVATYGLTSNTGYISRSNKEHGDFKAFEKKLDTNLYMTSRKALSAYLTGQHDALPPLFIEALNTNACIVWDEIVLCKKGIQDLDLTGIAPASALAVFNKKDRYLYRKTEIGELMLPHDGDGWSAREGWGVWSAEKVALLPLMLPSSEALKLVLDIQYFLDPDRHPSFQMDIFVNDFMVESRVCNAENAGKPIEIRFSKEELAAAQGKMRIKFVFDTPMSPAELGHSLDPRKLALGLRKATLQRLEETPAPHSK